MSNSNIWKGNSTFILAAAGSAVGLEIFGNFHTWWVQTAEVRL